MVSDWGRAEDCPRPRAPPSISAEWIEVSAEVCSPPPMLYGCYCSRSPKPYELMLEGAG